MMTTNELRLKVATQKLALINLGRAVDRRNKTIAWYREESGIYKQAGIAAEKRAQELSIRVDSALALRDDSQVSVKHLRQKVRSLESKVQAFQQLAEETPVASMSIDEFEKLKDKQDLLDQRKAGGP